MNSVVDAVRDYFEERNRIWVTGETKAVLKVGRGTSDVPWYRTFRKRISAKHREMSLREGHVLRSHSNVQIERILQENDGKSAWVTLRERVTWVYRLAGEYTVESRLVAHRQHWVLASDEAWSLAADVESGEGTGSKVDRGSRPNDMLPKPRQLTGSESTHHYDRVRALRYAELWWDGYNPSFAKFESDDCTNFVSQCLLSGTVRMTDGGSRAVGWWYRFPTGGQSANWSYSWSTANALVQWLLYRLHAEVVPQARELKIGDLIFYDWTGNGKFGHSAIVVDFDASGAPLVNAHTDASYHRHYAYLDSRAWTPNTRYLYVHIPSDV